MKFKIISETPIGLYEVRKELLKIKDRDEELAFRAQKTVSYLEQVLPLNDSQAKELLDKISKLEIPRLKEVHINKLLDILPASSNGVKTVLQAYALTITNENLKKIAETIAEHVKNQR